MKVAFLILVSAFILTACGRQEPMSQGQTVASDPNAVELTKAAAELAKIESARVETRENSSEIETTGQIKADENRVFHINSIVEGRVVKDNVVLGKVIKEGEQLAVIQNLDVAKTYGQYIHEAHQNEMNIDQTKAKLELATKNLDRLKRLKIEGIVAEKDLLLASNQEKLLQIELHGYEEHAIHIKSEAKALLSAYGVDLGDLDHTSIDPRKIETGSPLIAPRSGVVIQKNVTVGDVVSPSQPLYVVADLSQVWLDIAIYDKDLEKIKEGETVEFNSDSLAGSQFKGQINYIQPSTGDGTRTFLARAVLPNPKLVLKPGMFGQIKITGMSGSRLPYLPDQAIQKFGNENFVFVDRGNYHYEKRHVDLGSRLKEGYLVSRGVSPGEMVVGSGSFKLKSEMLKSQIGNED
jgi:cobalt-zinc-cadmium efflux system membrane fusion protein